MKKKRKKRFFTSQVEVVEIIFVWQLGLVALDLHDPEKASTALLSGQWSRTCLIRGHFGLGWPDQSNFVLSLVWSEAKQIDFFQVFKLFYWQMLSLLRIKTISRYSEEKPIESTMGLVKTKGSSFLRSHVKSFEITVVKGFLNAKLSNISSSIQLETWINGYSIKFFVT